MRVRVTWIGTATALLDVDGVRLLTDPALDPPGRRYSFGFGTASTKTDAPAVVDPGPVDAVLLSHDQHADNFDDTGRAYTARAPLVVTTARGAGRVGPNARGLRPWESTTVGPLTITATPARHGWPGSLPLVGPVVGFHVRPTSSTRGVWITGDTVLFRGVHDVAARLDVGAALVHVGCVRLPPTGPLRYTMDADEAVACARLLGDAPVVPIHCEGWTHFRQGRADVDAAFSRAGLAPRLRWPPKGAALDLDV